MSNANAVALRLIAHTKLLINHRVMVNAYIGSSLLNLLNTYVFRENEDILIIFEHVLSSFQVIAL